MFGLSAISAWGAMWLLAVAIFLVCKAVSFRNVACSPVARGRKFAYWVAWPGLNAEAFLASHPRARVVRRPAAGEWLFAAAKLILGCILLICAVAFAKTILPGIHPTTNATAFAWFTAWLGMMGIVFALHFGAFALLSCWWRFRGVEARPLMDWPILSASLAEFWGRRWNTAFRDFAHRLLFRPLTRRFGPAMGLLAGFAFSGLVHDLVISVPAGGGYGGPTIYFLLQGIGILLERAAMKRRPALHGALAWRALVAIWLIAPLPLLFHGPFLERVILPFLQMLGNLP